ncbi:MAG: bifunctional methylenetetrahydrofolate dehydrogenase/methenyltetrahydrofolate cyclohydrolase FolD [Saezia sp.]
MTAQLIDGNALAQHIRQQIKTQTHSLIPQYRAPGLAVILVGENPASQVYVRNKVKACAEVGFNSVMEHYPDTITESELIAHIQRLNQDNTIDGILLQLPLPKHLNEQKIIETIALDKDVDGFHIASAGALMVGAQGFRPCTPYGCMKMLESINYDISGKNAVIIGRSNIVGKPMALLLLEKNATVSICHSKTKNLKHFTLEADILVSATGRQNMVTADMVKPGAVVIDVGINRNQEGKLCGDVDFEAVKNVAGWITPVPGGVGPMTITMLLANTLESALQHF